MMNENEVWNRYARTMRRRQQLERVDAWLRAHPVWNWTIGIGFAIVVLSLSMLVKWLMLGCVMCEPLNR
jgi:hypothetical protein